ncbi:hypothetical protein BV25DRAFT_1775645, partial [Artomyces pyxidatus]
TEFEQQLQDALHDANTRDGLRKKSMVGMQATVVLQGIYVKQSQRQLQAQEDKRMKKGKKRILSDGLPKLLTSDVFFSQVEEHEAAAEKAVADKEARRVERADHVEAILVWKAEEKARKARVTAQRDKFHKAVKAWE